MPEALLSLISQYGYPILFTSVLLMNAGVPLPGHTTYLAAAILSGRGASLQLPWIIIGSVIAAFIGAAAGFEIGRRGGRKLVDTYGPKIGLSAPRVASMDRFFERHGGKAVFLTRFFVIIRTFGHIFAGVNGVPAARFLLITAAGAAAWAVIFGLAGYLLGERFHIIEDYFGTAGLVVLGLLAIAGVIHVLRRHT